MAAAPCSKCGVLLLPDARFCSQCGTSVVSTCPCGRAFQKDERFCNQCGAANTVTQTSINATARPPNPAPQQPKRASEEPASSYSLEEEKRLREQKRVLTEKNKKLKAELDKQLYDVRAEFRLWEEASQKEIKNLEALCAQQLQTLAKAQADAKQPLLDESKRLDLTIDSLAVQRAMLQAQPDEFD